MDSEIKVNIKFKLVVGCIALVLLAGVVAWLYKISGIERELKAPGVVVSVAHTSLAPVETHKNLFAAEEAQREAQLELQRGDQEIAKRKARKEKSNECQFWRLQEKQGKSSIASKKVEHYCVLSAEEYPIKL